MGGVNKKKWQTECHAGPTPLLCCSSGSEQTRAERRSSPPWAVNIWWQKTNCWEVPLNPLLSKHPGPHHRHEIDRNVYKPADQRWMDKLAIEDGGAVSVRWEKVDQHNDLHLIVEGEPPAFGIGWWWYLGRFEMGKFRSGGTIYSEYPFRIDIWRLGVDHQLGLKWDKLPGKEEVCEGLQGGEECKDNPVHHPLHIPSASSIHFLGCIQFGLFHLVYVLLHCNNITATMHCWFLTLWRSWSWPPCSWRRLGKECPSPGRSPGRGGERSLQSLY